MNKEPRNLTMEPEQFKSTTKTIIDHLLFFCSASIIAAILYGLRPLNGVVLFMSILSLFWLITAFIYRRICKEYVQYIDVLEACIKAMSEENEKKVRNR